MEPGHKSAVLETPPKVDRLQAAQAEIDRIGRQRFQRPHIDKSDCGRMEAIRGFEQLGSKRVVQGAGLVAALHRQDHIAVRLTGQDQVTLLDQPDRARAEAVQRAPGLPHRRWIRLFLVNRVTVSGSGDLEQPSEFGSVSAAQHRDEAELFRFIP